MSKPAPPFFQWVVTQYSTSAWATMSAFESDMMAWRPLIGPGIGARFQFATVSPQPWNQQAAAMAWLTGIGGVAHGQNALQPLSNPYGGS